MSKNHTAAIILAAGKGTRMKSGLHKVLHPIGGLPMVSHLLGTLDGLSPERRIVVVGSLQEQVEAALPGLEFVTQAEQLGTGHAVMVCREALKDFAGDVIVLFGDVPFTPLNVMQEMMAARASSANPGIVVLGFEPADPARYGRLVRGGDGTLERIVEYKDATEEERAITLCNSGMMVIDGNKLFGWLDKLSNANAAGEYYLTDLVAAARGDGRNVAVVVADEADVLGINDRNDLAAAEAAFQARKRREMMTNGVTLVAPETVFFSHDTIIEPDVTVEPNVVFGPGVTVATGAVIHAFSHLEGATVAADAVIGPFARLRPAAHIGKGAKIGNFVEVKKADIEPGAKVNHLSYIGDATVGAKANIGAGTITCNYDGYFKYRTEIGAGAFIGSNTALVAPVKVGDGAIVGAGSVITKTVEADALALTRASQNQIEGYAARFRKKSEARKAEKKGK
ncbi:bifunctional UDP-N-acetylglucosamine diphosphorylase/glucosamine-1-phosphate N-acetyltransferase GlmU [Gimibacter soli]|uniref:Bifunctional protein GlmU n=1 Tax=Gimibacter soli TaxID=3024400 RepID=A0AAF0BMX3_9PROT|nr:bifunctional UDP-N-acetylglucosamine diphosphorylase/glucosamine-1-phosphate N-acetyltransferase GlmU [Gimibacter soli]WCL55141.1 bifunctional UDP-N-acetylglucosamine diphosphorylase/glucosamine-1-phosphate N-acetyltransferase GlmU [Gimibacter soli]